MKYLKLFENTQQYESYKNGSDYVLPHVSYVKETKGIAYEPKKAFTLRAKYEATPDNLVAFTGATNIQSLKVNGTTIKIEPIKNEISTFDVLGENISIDMDTGAASFPESYLIKSPVSSWSLKPKDPNYTINENTYVCMLGMMDGMTMAEPIPLAAAMGYYFTTTDGVTLELADEFLPEMNTQIQSGMQISFTLADVDVNSQTFTFIDTEHQTSVTTGGLPTYSFDSEGFYDVKIDLADPNIKMAFTATSLTSIEIGNNITSIGGAFYDCHNLTSITIPNSVTSIGEEAFNSCRNLTSVTIPDRVTEIGHSAFCECSSLTSVTIPDSVTTIGSSAFRKCSSLTSVTIGDSVTMIGDAAFKDCTSLTSVNIPDSVTSIGSSAFINCTSLTRVTIGNSVTSIGSQAFSGCTSLTSVNIPDSVTSIGGSAFWSCSSLTSITIPDGVTSIGHQTFYNCSSLTSATIPNSVTSIGTYAFQSCNHLTSVTIPDRVTEIGSLAFYYCSNLTSVYCKATTPPALGDTYVFDSNGSGRKIYVPTSSVSAYKSANGWSKYAAAIVGYNF